MKIEKKDEMKHHSLEYPMDIGAPAFAPVAVKEEKDKNLNTAKLHAKQEYERIMEQVDVLRKQAESLMNRLNVTELILDAECTFNPIYDKPYSLYFSEHKQKNVLLMLAPHEWSSGTPDNLKFIVSAFKKGDSTWEEVIENN